MKEIFIMSPWIENTIVLLLVSAAVGYIIWCLRAAASGGGKCVCGTKACTAASKPTAPGEGGGLPIVQISTGPTRREN